MKPDILSLCNKLFQYTIDINSALVNLRHKDKSI